MKVLHLFLTFPNKWQRYSYQLLCRLADAGIDTVAVSVASEQERASFSQYIPFPLINLTSNAPLPVRRVQQLSSFIRGWEDRDYFTSLLRDNGLRSAVRVFSRNLPVLHAEPEVVHIHHAHAVGLNLLKTLSWKSIPWIVSFRGHDLMVRPLIDENWLSKVKWIFKHATALHVVSEALGERAIELGAPEGKLHVIHRSLEVDEVPSVEAPPSPPYRLVSVGRLVWEKGHIYAVDAVATLAREGVPIEYQILGEGPLEAAVRYRAWQLDISDQVNVAGFIENRRLDEILVQSHIILHPSLSEAMPNTLIRAQAMGLPAVSTLVGGIPEVVEDNMTGYLVSPADPAALAAAVRRLLTGKDTWADFSENARKRANCHFRPDVEVNEFMKLYSLVSKRL